MPKEKPPKLPRILPPEGTANEPPHRQKETPKKSAFKKEKGKKAPAEREAPKISVEESRNAYIQVKLDLEKEPQNPKLAAEFESAQKVYLEKRRKDLQSKLEIIKKEVLKGKDAKTVEKELRKAASMDLMAEFKQSYDAKTKILAEEKAENKPWILKKLQSVGEWYNQRSFKEKLLISGILMGGAAASLAIGGGAGTALGVLIGAGKLGQRILSGSAYFVGLEGFLKKSQEKTLANESILSHINFEKSLKESLAKVKLNKSQGLVKFLQAHDLVLEEKLSSVTKNIEKRAKQLENRRYLIAGSAGVLVASGVTAAAFEKLGESVGLSDSIHQLLGRTGLAGPELAQGVGTEEIIQAAEKHADFTATVQEGGSISKAAWQLVHEGKLSKEEMLQAWNNSFVEINGVQVPIKDVALSHAGDQVTYVPGASGSPSHLEILDFAKDKLSLGTNQDLAEIYEKMRKEQPNWLKAETGEDVFEAMKDNTLDANEAKNISFWFERGSLNDQEVILEQLNNKIGYLDESAGRAFVELRDSLADSPNYNQATEIFSQALKEATGLTDKQYLAVRDIKVGEFLEKRGRSWWADYFFSSDNVPAIGGKEGAASASEILHQRKLAKLLRNSLLSGWEKNLTIDQFLKIYVK